jgi:predicted O-methyltransferase YrrM
MEQIFKWPEKKPNVQPDEHGWFVNSKTLLKFISPQTKLVVELGSWLGLSTRFILHQAFKADVIAIDHWSDNIKDYGNGGATNASSDPGIEKIGTLWETFLVNCWEYKDRLHPVRAYTKEGLESLRKYNLDVDVVYIDASHSYDDVMSDITLSRELWPKAQIIGDDYAWESVKQAVHDYANKHNLKVMFEDNCWYYVG